MSKYNYATYKIIIAPDSHKTQGLQVGDVVRRQYRDANQLIYSLMIVLETGTDIISSKESHYFIGALVEGDVPQNGELLDFVRVTNLFDEQRSGALYLTASDSNSPYLDVIDGLATERSLYLMDKRRCIHAGEIFEFPITGRVAYPERMVISYHIRASKPLANVALSFGYSDGSETDGTDAVDISTEWQYKLTLITVDYPPQYDRKLTIAPVLSGEDWCEISDLNIVRLSDIATFSDSTKTRIGKITGIIDPVFGILNGYGAYFQNLYATRNVNIAGTLTAGDANGYASTFYVGKIHKNVIPDSVGCLFSGGVVVEENSPVGIGHAIRVDRDTELTVQSVSWRRDHAGQRYSFSIWIKSDAGKISFYQDEHFIREIEITVAGEWRRHKVSFIVSASERPVFTVGMKSGLNGILLTAPQMESGETITQYQPTDAQLSYTEDYGAWFCKGGIGGTIQNPLLRLNEDGSICSRDGSFVIHADGTGHFAGGKFKWTKDDIELTDMTIRWGELDEVAKDQILSQVKPSNIRAFVSSNLPTTQIYNRETNVWQPSWGNTPLLLTPSLYIDRYGETDLITEVADLNSGKPGIKPGSTCWYKNGVKIVSGQDSCTVEGSMGKYVLRIKANHIGPHAPQIRYAFQAIWLDGSGSEYPINADLQFTQLVNPGSTVVAVAYAPDGNIFRDGAGQLRAHCDLWRGAKIDNTNVDYRWGVKDESVFANAQLSMSAKAGSYTIALRSVANMIPGRTIYLIGHHAHVIQSVDVQTKTVTLTTPLIRDYVVNAIVTTPFYDSLLGPGWALLNEDNPRGTVSGWNTNELVLSADAVRNFETFKCSIKDTDMSAGNGFAGQIVCDILTFTDLSDPYFVEITGKKGFIVKNDDNDIEARAVVYRSGDEKDVNGMVYHYNWKLFNADGTQVVRSYQGKQITVSKDDVSVRGALMCEVYDAQRLIARGQASLSELSDGEDAYSVQILTDNGTNFINGNITTTLIAYVYQGGEDITNSLSDNQFNWFRISNNPDGDTVWNELHAGIGRNVALTDEDVFRRATFTCEVIIH